MKSFIYVTLLLITLSFCDDCSLKPQDQCTGTCEWTAGTAASCVVKTDCAAPTGDTGNKVCPDATNCKVNGDESACESVATTCAVNTAGTACETAAGCVFTDATEGTCAESSSDTDTNTDTNKSSAFGLKTSFLLIFLYFFF